MIHFDNSYARLPQGFFTRTAPTPVRDPSLIALNRPLAETLGLDADWLAGPEGVQMLAGNVLPEGAEPIAQAYAGHQFGGFSPQLGDGRAVLLGEILAPDGRRFDLQLKGAGPTPFSRRGDGRAWLGPVLREYLVSEFMAAFGIPTTRALAAVATGETVIRETILPGAVLARVAASHIRVGTFEFYAARGDRDRLQLLADHVIARHYPQASGAADLLQRVVEAQAKTIAGWMGLGFIHGVMNTDNMSVSGETIDYGPCAFMDGYRPDQVFSSIDAHGRYASSRRPTSSCWTCRTAMRAMCGPTLRRWPRPGLTATSMPLRSSAEWLRVFGAKLGIAQPRPEDRELIERLLSLMAAERADFTRVFAGLSDGTARDEFIDREAWDRWSRDWQDRIGGDGQAAQVMARANPRRIPRNHRIEQAIAAARDEGDFTLFHRLDAALRQPFQDRPDWDDLAVAPAADEIVQRTFCGT
ncbi:YdiU family protein [Paracoccus mutanolyticus]|uniref:Protein nucleotidyltransferase YdiU n=1 Tax=Paracoccus mutanolyticus TaxID=1499308 RepID=A0ABN5M812_9RHOB|nr:YdiU family protein [Paracoccus mutanolyticus]AWX94079.1 YdiU family protein [Paracoccus mutanolyticus]